MMRRPLLGIGLVFFLSTAAALLFGFNFSVAVGLFLLLCSLLSLLLVRRFRRETACMLLAAAIAMGLCALREARQLMPLTALDGHTVYLQGRVTEIRYYASRARYLLDARIPLQGGGQIKTRLPVYTPTHLPTALNEELCGYVSLQLLETSGKYRWQNLSEGIVLSGSFQEEPEIHFGGQVQKTPGYLITALRQYLVRQNERLLPPDAAAIINAMLLGDKQSLSEDVLLDFRRAGILHLMAVSGFHVALIAALVLRALGMVGLSRRASALLSIPFIALFVALAGFTSSAVRAGLMTGLAMTAMALHKQYDPPSALGFAMLAECIFDPYAALSTGFLLSFLACMGILFAGPKICSWLVGGKKAPENAGGWGRLIWAAVQAIGVSLAASLFTLPVQIYLFDTVSLLAPLASALAMPAATLGLWLAVLSLLVGAIPFLFPLAKLLSLLTALFARLTAGVAALFSALPFSVLPVRYEFIQWLVLLAYLCALILALRHAPKSLCRLCALLAAGVFAAGLVSAKLLYRDTVQLTVFSGMDTAVLIRDDQAAVIGFPKSAYQERVVASYLRDLQIRSVELALCTGVDNEEAAGTPALFREYPPRQVVMPSEGRYTENILHALPYGQRVVNRARMTQLAALGTEITLLPCSCGVGCEIDFGGAKLLKTNEECVIMKSDGQTQGIIRGWTLIKRRRDGQRMKISEQDGERSTYTFRIQKGG